MIAVTNYVCKEICRVFLLGDDGRFLESDRVPVGTRAKYVGHFGPQKGMVRLKTEAGLLIEVSVEYFNRKWKDVS